jgi:hypothetical protein
MVLVAGIIPRDVVRSQAGCLWEAGRSDTP